MSEGDFPRPGQFAAADQPGVADSVMRRAEGARLHQWHIAGQHVGHAIDAGRFQSFFNRQVGQDARQCTRQQRLARAGAAAHQAVVPPSGRHLQRAFGYLLPLRCVPKFTNASVFASENTTGFEPTKHIRLYDVNSYCPLTQAL